MPGTAAELVPGGLLDRLAATAEPDALSPVRSLMAAGAPALALSALDDLRGADPVAVLAWRHFAWHACWLALPDGDARPPGHLIPRMLEQPPRPEPRTIVRAEDWIVGHLLTDLRNARAGVTIGLPGDMAPVDEAGTHLGARTDLRGHLDLLAADMAARAADRPAAEACLRSARHRLSETGDVRGRAAVALVAGDLLVAPLGWNCVLTHQPNSLGAELPGPVEAGEFTSSPGAIAAARDAYAEAERLYAGDGAGLAAVALRRAYLEVLEGRPGAAVVLAARARRGFAEAGRPLDEAIAAVHVALAGLADDAPPDDTSAVEPARAAVVGHAPALGLGLLCARVGRQWAIRGRAERGSVALGLAARAFETLGEPVLQSQAVVTAGTIAARLGAVAAVRLAIRDALAADGAPLAEPADPADPRRQRRAQLATRLHLLAREIGDVAGMERASAALDEVLEPLRRGLGGYTGRALFLATELLTLTGLIGNPVPGLVHRARVARDAGDDRLASRLLNEARAVVDDDFGRAVVHAYAGEPGPASAAFARCTAGKLAGTAVGGTAWRMAHIEGFAFQLTVGHTGAARAHYDALRRTGPEWWAGIGAGWEHRDLVGRLLEQEGDPAGALAVFDRALDEIEQTRGGLRRDELRTSFFALAGVQNVYLDAARAALAAGEPARAFGYAGRARARALRDRLAANLTVAGSGLPAGLVDGWRTAEAEVTLAQDRMVAAPSDDRRVALATARFRLARAERELHDADPRFWAAVSPQATVDDLTSVAAGLPEGVAVIQYMAGAEDLLGWAVTREGLVCPYARRVALAGPVSRLADACAAGRPYEGLARDLAGWLLEPLRPVIERSTALFVIPSGPLARLPFGALPWDDAPLGTALPITVLPGAGLPGAGSPRTGNGRSLVVGDPSDMAYRSVPQPALPGAAAEAVRVAGTLGDARLLMGSRATRERVLAGLAGAPVAHFATHGVLDPEAPLGTAILLAGGESVTAAELFGVRLDADLVVVSACRTGSGPVVRGDELLGLGRALVSAGARSVLLTLWQLDDVSAALLMAEFHRRRSAGTPDAVALQEATAYLRGLGRDDACAAFGRMAAGAVLAGRPAVAALAERAARDLGAGPAHPLHRTPYAHPLHWAPYVLISTGG